MHRVMDLRAEFRGERDGRDGYDEYEEATVVRQVRRAPTAPTPADAFAMTMMRTFDRLPARPAGLVPVAIHEPTRENVFLLPPVQPPPWAVTPLAPPSPVSAPAPARRTSRVLLASLLLYMLAFGWLAYVDPGFRHLLLTYGRLAMAQLHALLGR